MNILRLSKSKKPKKPAIENYKISYLDKRSKKYHNIVMSGVIVAFGFVGWSYLFSSNASSPNATDSTNNSPLLLIAVVIVVFIAIFAVLTLLGSKRKK